MPWRLAQKGVALNCMSPDGVHTPPDTPQLDVGDPVPRSADQHSSHLLPKECCFSNSRLLNWRCYKQRSKPCQVDNEHIAWLRIESCRKTPCTTLRQTTDEVVLQWSCHGRCHKRSEVNLSALRIVGKGQVEDWFWIHLTRVMLMIGLETTSKCFLPFDTGEGMRCTAHEEQMLKRSLQLL